MSDINTMQQLREWLSGHIIGQNHLVERLLMALLADGHLLVEGAPGLAKTKAIKTLSDGIEGNFHRIQFTPDLLPSDVTGTDVYRQETHTFEFQPGPVFHNLVLADEINRAPAKVQSALLEAMAERQISVGRQTYPLPDLFLVMATQNPIEQEGTYPLPEAQLDRFLMHVEVKYPNVEAEKRILQQVRLEAGDSPVPAAPTRLSQTALAQMRQAVLDLHMADTVEDYIVQLTMATREPAGVHAELANWIEFGVSPRGTIALDRCARAHAWLQGNDFVSPDNVQAVIHDVFRHRLLLTFEAEANGVQANQVIDTLVSQVAVG
ncbi:MoxR family ATPase [Exilibacterium tricleocarpae]|uniref:MoxR family ATPase n=1 Tax=Exilibacterium tricleocarpae TaxID=2591008 RepID=A0A545TUU3_9GAMM|nr:MoxR family ATPase [Exilibacterium tricleocarpae]TQV80993.1 MoxR family ATPase [Exilibacterium tricleocarpae]